MPKVMVVDDDASTRMHCREMLAESGFDVAEAANGADAIAVYEYFQPNMVFMDMVMPGVGGLEALKEIRMIDPKALVAIFIVEGQQALILEAFKTGAVDFVIKPLDREQVLGAVRNVLG